MAENKNSLVIGALVLVIVLCAFYVLKSRGSGGTGRAPVETLLPSKAPANFGRPAP